MKQINNIGLAVLLVITLSTFAFSQGNKTLSGRIFDQQTQEVLPFATVVLNTSDNQSMVSGVLSEDDGRFVLSGLNPGNYILVSSYIGYQSVEIPVLIGELNDHYDVGKIEMPSESQSLDEVVIEAKKSIANAGLDKRNFTMEDQVAQSGGSILDAMKALPGVNIDQDGNVLLRGSSQVSILMDGKQSGITGFGSQQGLANIPAANIERIEIINNPSAKYDAAGMAGIINIIYKKEKQSGFNGDVGFAFGSGANAKRKSDLPTQLGSYSVNPKYIPSVNLNYRTSKVSSFLQGEMLSQKKLPNNEFTTRNYKDGANTISQVPENRTQNHYILKGGLDYHIDPKNTLSFSSIFDYEHHIDTSQIAYIDQNTNERYRYWHWKEDEITGYLNFRLNFEHDFKQPGHDLTIAAQYVRGWEDESYFLNDSSAVRQGKDDTHILATENTSTFSLDYQKPLKSGRVEFGSRIQFRTIPVTYDINRGNQSIIYEGLGDWSDWGENIYAAYGNYILEKNKYDIEGGLRIEQTNVFYDISPENIYYPNNDKYDYFKLYPNVRFTIKPNLRHRLSLFYNNRVDRPGEPNLRIFPKFDDPELLKVGDPYIRPQFTQTMEAAYKRLWESGSVMASLYYRIIDSPFLRIYSIDDSNSDYSVVNKIYQNVGSGSNRGIEVLLAQNLTSFWKMTGSFNWYNNIIDAYEGTIQFPYSRPFFIEKTNNNTWDTKINNSFKMLNNTEIQLTAIYLAPKNTPQGRILSRSSIDLGVKKIMFENKVEFSLAMTDIFNRFGIREEIKTEEFDALYENYFETQVYRLGFKYKW